MNYEEISVGTFLKFYPDINFSWCVWNKPHPTVDSEIIGKLLIEDNIMVVEKTIFGGKWMKVIVFGKDLIGWTPWEKTCFILGGS